METQQQKDPEKQKEREELINIILKELDNGNIVFPTIDGLMKTSLLNFIEQPLEGMLYDLNHLKAVLLTRARYEDGVSWIQDLSLIKLLEYYYYKANKVSD